jgi:hypothetical protein
MPISQIINKVTAIEAYYPTFCHLKNNIILNNIKNIETHNIAIGDRRETIHFTTNDDRWTNNSGGMRVITELDKQLKELDVFFEEYLEVFDDQLNASDKSSPVWKAYNDKYKAYEFEKYLKSGSGRAFAIKRLHSF